MLSGYFSCLSGCEITKARIGKFSGFLIEVKAVQAKLIDNADIEKILEELAWKGLQQIKQK